MCKKYLLYVQKYILSNKWSFIGGIFFSILKSIISLLVPLTFSAIVDQALSLDKFIVVQLSRQKSKLFIMN